jgi:AraC-like DNA-binding protein
MPRCAPLENGWQYLADGSGPDGVLMACGHLDVTFRGGRGLFDYLDGPLVQHLGDADPLRAVLAGLLGELAAPRPGTRALTRALMEQCLVLLLRRICPDGRCSNTWLLALEDRRLGRAVAAMHAAPEDDHSVGSLARTAGMSRSAFARRFVETFGRGPMDFLREVRLRRAAELLERSDLPVKALAGEVGYTSRSYFSRAFKDFYGVSPGAFRASGQARHP